MNPGLAVYLTNQIINNIVNNKHINGSDLTKNIFLKKIAQSFGYLLFILRRKNSEIINCKGIEFLSKNSDFLIHRSLKPNIVDL